MPVKLAFWEESDANGKAGEVDAPASDWYSTRVIDAGLGPLSDLGSTMDGGFT